MSQRSASVAVLLLLVALLGTSFAFAGGTVHVQATGDSVVPDLIDDPDPVPALWLGGLPSFARWSALAVFL
jgi:hypothetical protein